MSHPSEHPPVIEAAGGLLWRETPQGRLLALVHRPKYDDWTLPKGKRKPGESWQETALREVAEETGCQPQLEGFAGATAYTLANGTPKVVLFWNMRLLRGEGFRPTAEVDQLVWLPPAEAQARLSYASEKALLQRS